MLMNSASSQPPTTLRNQWVNPGDVFSLLLILGGDIVQRAIAQQVGHFWAPVAFSFGHVAYGFSALLAAFGDGRLMPPADFDALVVGARSGHQRTNTAWVIGRLLRDHEDRTAKLLAGSDRTTRHESLRVSVFRPTHRSSFEAGVPRNDYVWWSGWGVMILQVVIAAIPWIVNRNWSIFIITVAGTGLSILQTSNGQWAREKWACPSKGASTVSITQGNGSRHVMVILGKDHLSGPGSQHGLDLEILAAKSGRFFASRYSRGLIATVSLLWIALLLTATGIQSNTWYLILVGAIGMLHNIVVMACPRDSSSLGIHLVPVTTITDMKVSFVLRKTEEIYPTVGTSLIPIFFPGGLRIPPDQEDFWTAAARKREAKNLSDIGIRVAAA